MLTKKNGDLFANLTDDNIIIPHITNNMNGFGSGFVVPLTNKWPITKELYHENKQYQQLGVNQYIDVEKNVVVCHMTAQDNSVLSKSRKVHYGYLAICMEDVATAIQWDRVEENKITEIHTVAFGSGIGGGDADIIDELIESIWKDIKVTMWMI